MPEKRAREPVPASQPRSGVRAKPCSEMDMTDRFATAMFASLVLGALIIDATSQVDSDQSTRSSAGDGASGSETGVWVAAAMSLLRLLN
jgi:hypothetical protein